MLAGYQSLTKAGDDALVLSLHAEWMAVMPLAALLAQRGMVGGLARDWLSWLGAGGSHGDGDYYRRIQPPPAPLQVTEPAKVHAHGLSDLAQAALAALVITPPSPDEPQPDHIR